MDCPKLEGCLATEGGFLSRVFFVVAVFMSLGGSFFIVEDNCNRKRNREILRPNRGAEGNLPERGDVVTTGAD